jgi:hypothetical protein
MMGGGIEVALSAPTGRRAAEAAGSAGSCSRQALSALAFSVHSDGQGVQRELLLRADALERASRTARATTRRPRSSGSSSTSTAISPSRASYSSPSSTRARDAAISTIEAFGLLLLTELESAGRTLRWPRPTRGGHSS